ncbi:hypothetical protein [Panacagrimonas sp.]
MTLLFYLLSLAGLFLAFGCASPVAKVVGGSTCAGCLLVAGSGVMP